MDTNFREAFELNSTEHKHVHIAALLFDVIKIRSQVE